MRKIKTESLVPGMIVGRPIFTEKGIVLLNVGTLLTQSYIDKIALSKVDFIYINDVISEGILAEPMISDEVQAVTKRILYDSLKRFREGHLSSSAKLLRNVEEIIEEVLSNPQVMISLQELRNKDEYMHMHALNVCVVSCVMGKKMEFTDKQMKLLALGALLHDIGKLQIDFDCTRYREDYVDIEFDLYKEHVKKGENMILAMRDINSVVSSVARQHHEHYDGSGFPNKIKGEAINELSRIVAVANEYDNLLYNMPEDQALKHYEIIEYITAKAFMAFDPHMVRVFRSCISPYPIGSGVLLSDGRVGIVSKINEVFPTRPVIRVLDKSYGEVVEEIDLSLNVSIMITGEKDIDKQT